MNDPKKPATEPVPELTAKQAARVLYGDDGKTAVKRVHRLIENQKLPATKLPGDTGAYLIKPADIRDYQKALQAKQDKKRRQSDTLD